MNGRAAEVEPVPSEILLSPQEIVQQSFALAVEAHESRRLAEAEQLYRAILAFDPLHADALHGLGVLAHQVGRNDIAEQFIRQALARRSDPTFHNNLGLVLQGAGRLDEALASVHRALELHSAYPQAYNALGNLHRQLGHRDEAIASYEHAVALREDYVDARVNLGNVLVETGDLDGAGRVYEKALELDPGCADAHNNYGNLLRFKGQPEKALAAFDRALAIDPAHAKAHNNRGVVLAALKMSDEAIAAFKCALAIRPDFTEALNGCGSMLCAVGKLEEAIECFERSLKLDSENVATHNDLGVALMQQYKISEAVASFERAIALADNQIAAASYFNLGNVLLLKNHTDKAIASYQKALEWDPGLCEAQNNLGYALQSTGNVAEAVETFGLVLARRPEYTDAFSNRLLMMHYLESLTNAELLEAACDFGRRYDRPDAAPFVGRDMSPERKLRIGYVSGDLNLHPVAFFFARVLAAHDKNNFEIFAYSNSSAEDNATAHIRQLVDVWRPIHAASDAEAADLIRCDAIDILVDLAGHTARNRLPLFGLKPAPVQASWLGYWASTGMETIDYIILDSVSAPDGADQWYKEAIARLPDGRFCYQTPFCEIRPNDPPSLSRGYITFGSFNNVAKVSAGVLRLWGAILLAVPNSRLVLKWKTLCEASTCQRILDAFANEGISADRIEMRGATVFEQMLSEYNDIDIALDPFPFGGGTTSCEALWMGVPVVTLPGERLSSRQTLGFLHLMGFEDLAAKSAEDYVAIAVSLASDPVRLHDLRRRLRPAFEASPICDGPGFTAMLERAYRQMWRRHVAGEKPEAFSVRK